MPELPDFLLPYLHLSAYPLHVPRPYSVMRTPDDDYVLMLESSALVTASPDGGPPGEAPSLLPMLTKRWADAPPLRQLSWLWQIAQLWDAFVTEKVAATLLDDALLRVDGSVVRLRSLASEPVPSPATAPVDLHSAATQPTLMNLGRFWQPLAESAQQPVRAFLMRLCERLERQQLTAEQLAEQLSQAIGVCGQGQVVNYDLAVYTDQGPTRKRNEDACYPESGTAQSLSSEQTRGAAELLIVCDGIGGHQGGDVASKLAIATIEARLKPLLSREQPDLSATELSFAIEAAICAANDEISAQNDQAQRQARDRMGTTLVLALIKGSDVFIAHLGDSRAYRISQRNCQQVTLDDDVASRQMRLGGGLYREVLPQPGAGSLIQALGMGSSQALRPTVQRFVLDENCVFLLCSDGLSDSDRVEQFWQPVLRPLVFADGSAQATGKRLVDLANKYNGHDNVTVGLVMAQVVRPSDRMVPRDLSSIAGASAVGMVEAEAGSTASLAQPTRTRRGQTRLVAPMDQAAADAVGHSIPDSTQGSASQGSASQGSATQQGSAAATVGNPLPNTALIQSSPSASVKPKGGFPKTGIAVLLLAALGGLLYFLFPGLSWRFTSGPDSPEAPMGEVSGNASRPATPSTPGLVIQPAELTVGSYARIRQSDIPGISAAGEGAGSSGLGSEPSGSEPLESGTTGQSGNFSQLKLYPKPEVASEATPNIITGTIPTGGIVKVVGKQVTTDGSEWVELQICSIPSGVTLDDVPAESDGTTGADSSRTADSSAEPLNVPETTQTDRPLILPPGSTGWIVAEKVAKVSENIQDLEPTQAGMCGA
ncbi:MAG: protein phosphatase 2C domain-containing protein [Cyanobacteria bacterium J06559_1]